MTSGRALANLDQATIGTDDGLRQAIVDCLDAECKPWSIARVLREGYIPQSRYASLGFTTYGDQENKS